MADPKTPTRDPIAALFDFSADDEQTSEEAEKELRAAGVDVEGLLSRMEARLQQQADEERLSWLRVARLTLRRETPTALPAVYLAMNRQTLLAKAKSRQSASLSGQAFFHKLDQVTDDDLRTLLVDFDDLDAL